MAQNSNENSDINNLQNSVDDYEEINENEEELKQNNRDSSIKEDKEIDKNDYERKQGMKQKRRSKNDCIGRDYVCGCGKTYLSYPALYTHIKTKHNGKTPEGTNANQVQSGRGRGRPRKNFLVDEGSLNRRKREINRKNNDGQNNELKDLLKKNNFNLDSYRNFEKKFLNVYKIFNLVKESKEKMFFDSDNESDNEIDNNKNNIGNNNLNNNLNNNSMDIEKDDFNNKDFFDNSFHENDNYNLLEQFPKIKEDNSGFTILYKVTKDLIEKGYTEIKEGDDKNITCDQSFCLFLIYISKYVKNEFFKIILILLKNYRDCMNILGWEILSKYKTLDDENTNLSFCSVKDPSRLPLIANEFLNEYLNIKIPNFDKYFSTIIIGHFNFWLFGNNLTFIKLDIINDDLYNENEDKFNDKDKSKIDINNNENIIEQNSILNKPIN